MCIIVNNELIVIFFVYDIKFCIIIDLIDWDIQRYWLDGVIGGWIDGVIAQQPGDFIQS